MRLMTLNIWNYDGNWDERRRVIAELIRTHSPEVVALQETRHDRRYYGGKGQGEQLAELTGYRATSAVAQVYVPVLRIDEGLTILTQHEPLGVAVCRLTYHPADRMDENHRICLGIRMDWEGKPVHIFNTHYSLSSQARQTNALETARFVEQQAGEEATVLMGDLNAEPKDPPIRFLTGQEQLEGARAEFFDSWVTANPDDPGLTYSSFDPVRRIDYVLARNIATGSIRAKLVGDQAMDGVYASDHIGIIVDLPE